MTDSYTFYDWTIRADMVQALERYIATGYPIGDFLTAILSNDLMKACHHADGNNKANLPAFAGYLYNKAPMTCHGSRRIVELWQQIGGQAGMRRVFDLAQRRDHLNDTEREELRQREALAAKLQQAHEAK